jgi:hypothetical protein
MMERTMPKDFQGNPPEEQNGKHKIELRAPWTDGVQRIHMYPSNVINSADGVLARRFLAERSALHELYIKETEKTKRFGYGLAAILLAIACLVPIFAPAGRETTSWIISAALFVFSAGSMGFTTIWLKMKKREMRVSSNQH